MDKQRLKGLMGLCVRARQAVFGEDGCRKALQRESCGVLLLDESASDNTRKRYRAMCAGRKIPLVLLPENLLAEATGRDAVAMAVLRGAFSEQIIRCLDENGAAGSYKPL